MKSKFKFILFSLLSILVFSQSIQANVDDKQREFLESLLDEDKRKLISCEISATTAHSAHGLATNEGVPVTKNDVERLMDMEELPTDSLQYELSRIAIDEAFKRISPDTTRKTMIDHCMSRPMYEVEGMGTSRQELFEDEEEYRLMEEIERAWERDGCEERYTNLGGAFKASFYGGSAAEIKEKLKSANNPALEDEMFKSVMNRDSDGFYELVDVFSANCGMGNDF